MSEWGSLNFRSLVTKYIQLQSKVVSEVKKLSDAMSTARPGKFLLVQFYMSQVTQVGESISNIIAQVNSMINKTVQNQRTT